MKLYQRKIGLLLFIFLWLCFHTSQSQTLRLLTINVWSGLDYNGIFHIGEYESAERREKRFNSLLQQIRQLHPDVVFIQEANPVTSLSCRLADSLDFDEIHQVCNAGLKFCSIGLPTNFREGIAILARKSIQLELYDVWKLSRTFGAFGDAISFHTEEANFALVGKIMIDQVPLYLINVHLIATPTIDSLLAKQFAYLQAQGKIGEDEYQKTLDKLNDIQFLRPLEVQRLSEYIQTLPSHSAIIVGGDFNSTIDSPELQSFVSSGKYIDTDINTRENNQEQNSDSIPKDRTQNIDRQHYTWDSRSNENIQYSTRLIDASGDSLYGYDYLVALYNQIPQRIDHIFLSDHFTSGDVIDSRIVIDSVVDGIHASDHYGFLSTIDLKTILQTTAKESEAVAPISNSQINGSPILSYDTDVGFGYGATGIFVNQFGINESFNVVAFNSTKGERWYQFKFSVPDFELRQGKIYPLSLDLSIDYDKWILYRFFGIGNRSSIDNEEMYTREPLDISLTLSRGFTKNIIGQVGFRYMSIRNFNFESDSRLIHIAPDLNASTVKRMSIVSIFRYDTRNSFLNPSRGVVLQGDVEVVPKIEISNITVTRLAAWFQYYTILFYPKTIFALRFGLQSLIGNDLPVQILLPIGGNKTLRGSPQDRYLDKASALVNAELRFPLIWRFGGVIGLDAGKVWSNISKFDIPRWIWNPVVGLRFYWEWLIIRMDFGFGKETTGFYLNFNHIF